MTNNFQFSILYTSDIHSYLDNFPKLSYLINKIRDNNKQNNIDTFVFDSGDVLTGNLYFNISLGKYESQIMNLINYNAMTFGNHEFDNSSELLSKFIENINFPIISTNVDLQNDKYLSVFTNKNNKILPFKLEYLSNGYTVAIIGLTTSLTPNISSPNANIIFNEHILSLKNVKSDLDKYNVSKIILLSHLGYEEDERIANEIDFIDIILGGHSHTTLDEYVTIKNKVNKKGTIIVHPGCYNRYLGELNLYLDDNGNICNIENKLHNIDDISCYDDDIKIIVDELKEKKNQLSSHVIGETAVDLIGDKEYLKLGKSNLGNLVADAFFHKAQQEGFDPDISIVNSGGIRSSIYKGKITYDDIVKVLPFAKSLFIIEATGKQIIDSLENGLFPQVSNLKLIYGEYSNTIQKLSEVLIFKNGAFIHIDETKTYIIATNSFVAVGKDNYIGFKNVNIIKSNVELDIKLFIEFIQSLPKPLDYNINNRIINRVL